MPRSTSDSSRPITVVSANNASCEDLQAVFGTKGPGFRCQCQRYKLRPLEYFAGFPVEERAFRLRQQTDCGHDDAPNTSGLVAYLSDEPVGWCGSSRAPPIRISWRTAGFLGWVEPRTRPMTAFGP